MKPWQKSIAEEWAHRQEAEGAKKTGYPLIEQNFEADEIIAMTEVILSGRLTMADRVREFEGQFAKYLKVPFAVMVNSGSSANLLAVAAARNPLRTKHLKHGDEVLVPAVCWSTSVWPLVQLGLKPVFVDVDSKTLNIDFLDLKSKATPKTKALMAVHILGNCGPMSDVLEFAKKNEWIVIEDTCESLGSKWDGKYLGSISDFGTYSFYFSHHMTTGEGGMVVCHTQEDYDLLKCLRAHGWTRELSNKKELEETHSNVDPRFLFVNAGFNLRPMEIQAALGIKQLEKLPSMNNNRIVNSKKLTNALKSHKKWKNQFSFPEAIKGAEPVWFGFPATLNESVSGTLSSFLTALTKKGVENRPIVSGNFARQPGLALFDVESDWKSLKGAEKVHERGFFIGLHTTELNDEGIEDLAARLLGD